MSATVPTTPEFTRERFQLDFFIPGKAWEGLFDSLEVWRSRSSDLGPYEPLHDDTWLPATLPFGQEHTQAPLEPDTGKSVPIVGLTSEFLLGEHQRVTVTFAGSGEYLTFAQAATQIVAQGAGLLVSFVADGILIVRTVEAGIKATLRCSGGDASPLLGLPTSFGAVAFGRDARIVLVHGQQDYGFVDPHGSPDYFYKTRFFNSDARTVSQFSQPFQGEAVAGLDTSELCRGYVDLVDLQGNPYENQEVLIYNAFSAMKRERFTVAGGALKLLTDRRGHAEALLVRGSKVVVGIGGAPVARDVHIPEDRKIESINLLSSLFGTNDVFNVSIPNIPCYARRSL